MDGILNRHPAVGLAVGIVRHGSLELFNRYLNNLSHLILLDTGGDSWWEQENAPELLAKRGFSRRKVELARRWFNGRTAPWEFFPTLMRLGGAYNPHTSLFSAVRTMVAERRSKARPQAEIFGFGQLMKGWRVMERLGEIRVPTLVMAGRDDFVFPPEHQGQLAAGIPNARLDIIERAGHNPHDERTADVMNVVRDFIPTDVAVRGEVALAVTRRMPTTGLLSGHGHARAPAILHPR